MEYQNSQSDLNKYNSAMQAYSNSLASESNNAQRIQADAQNKNDEAADSYNTTMKAIVEPVGAEILKDPLTKLIKKGTTKLLGATKEAATAAVQDVKNGINPGTRLVNSAQRTLSSVRNGLTETKNEFGKLAQGTQKILNNSRLGRGLRGIGSDDPAVPSANSIGYNAEERAATRAKILSRLKPGARVSQSVLGNAAEEAEADTLPSIKPPVNYKSMTSKDLSRLFEDRVASDVDPLAAQGVDAAAAKSVVDFNSEQGMSSLMQRVGARSLAESQGAMARPFGADAGTQDSGGPMRAAMAQTDPLNAGGIADPLNGARLTTDPTAPDATPNTGGTGAGSNAPDPLGTQQSALPKAALDDPAPKPVGKGVSKFKSALETIPEEEGDIIGAGGGPEDPFADLLGALVGLGTIIGGAIGGKTAKKVAPVQFQNVNPSVQFGI